jgi:transcriptional regulator with GAF, ATPase, and Fis domain
MAMARLIVVDGPDLGREFDVPMRGGGIGRGDGNLVTLGDPSVSRQHCTLELRDGALCLVDPGSRNKTLVNGQPITVHRLEAGDEIVVGQTRLAYLPQDGVAVTRFSGGGKVTMEVSSRQLVAMSTAGAGPGAGAHDARAQRYLAAMAELGDKLRSDSAAGGDAVGRAATTAAITALSADRAFVLSGTAGRLSPTAAAVAPGDPAGHQLHLSRDVVDKVVREGKAITVEAGGRQGIAVPLPGATADDSTGLFWIDRKVGAWDTLDAMAAACLANLVAAALVGAEARDQLARGKAVLEERLGDGEFIGKSPASRKILEFVNRVGPSDATVLLGGESGSGKEMVSRAIHRASRRARGPCVAVNCAALTETLIESELFGHEKGAFTGATDKKIGRFEMADKGTLFLDEVGELPLNLQTKFLRVLEERRFERVGGQRPIEVDVRVVAATNRDLSDMVRRGTFREDLFYRLSVIHIVVPPLRERPEDVILLADHFLARFRAQAGRRITGFSPDAHKLLASHAWPGNVRELRNAVERAVVLGDGEWIRGEDLPPTMTARHAAPRRTSSPTPPLGSMAIVDHGGHASHSSGSIVPPSPATAPQAIVPGSGPLSPATPTPQGGITPASPHAPAAAAAEAPARSLRELEKEGILAALAATGGNKAQAAAILEIDRSTLYKKLKEYGIG